MAMIDAREVHERDMREDAAYRQEYEALADEFQVVEMLIAARTRAGKTQRDVAAAMGVKQPVVARIEAGGNISIRTLQRYAKALGQTVEVRLRAG